MTHDFLPSKDVIFNSWQDNLLRILGETDFLEKLDIPKRPYDNLMPLQAEWSSCYAATINPKDRTSAQVTAKREARKKFEKALRIFIKAYLTYNPALSDDERAVMRLPVHKKLRTPVSIPQRYPFFKIDNSVIRRLRIYFYDDGNERRLKPAGVHGAEIKWNFSDVTVVNPDNLTNSGFATASPYTIEFAGEDRGRMVYIAMRWENSRGERGPWSEIISTIVP
jgi:hypothetical protein